MLYPGIPTTKSLPPIRSKRCTHMLSVSFLIMRTQAQRLHACSRWTSTVSSAATPSCQTKNKLIIQMLYALPTYLRKVCDLRNYLCIMFFYFQNVLKIPLKENISCGFLVSAITPARISFAYLLFPNRFKMKSFSQGLASHFSAIR